MLRQGACCALAPIADPSRAKTLIAKASQSEEARQQDRKLKLRFSSKDESELQEALSEGLPTQ